MKLPNKCNRNLRTLYGQNNSSPVTVTGKAQSSNNPPLSVHVQMTVFTPTPWKKDPDSGTQTEVVMVPSCASTQVGGSQLAELPTLLARDVTTTGAGQVITGGELKPVQTISKPIVDVTY